MTDSLTEAIARAIHIESILALGRSREDAEYAADIGLSDWQAGQRGGPSWWVAFDGSMRAALAALSCIEQAGYVVVEVAPIQAAFRECAQAYRAMGYANLAQRIEDAALLASRPRVEG